MKFTLYAADCTGNAKNTIYPHQKVITSEADLKKAVASDHVCAKYDNDTRCDANFQISDVVPMDCDNDHSNNPDDWITPEKLSEMLTDVAFAVTYSRHHMLAKGSVSARPRFHVFFPTMPCKDAAFHKSIKARIHKELPFFDGNALDASRFLFGSKGDVVWHESSLTIEDWLQLMKTSRSIPQGQRNSTMSRMAGKLVKRFGVTEDAHAKFLEKAAECDPPLDDAELENIWASACKFGRKVTSQEGYVPPDQYSENSLIPDDFSDVGEARTFVDCYSEEIAFTVATNYLRYNGVYWEESEQAAVMAMIEHADTQVTASFHDFEAGVVLAADSLFQCVGFHIVYPTDEGIGTVENHADFIVSKCIRNGKIILCHLEVILRPLAAGRPDAAESAVFACLVVAVAVCSKSRSGNEDFVRPAEQFFLRDLRRTDVVPAGLKDNHANDLDVIQGLEEVECTQCIHLHLAVVFGINQNAETILEIHHCHRAVRHADTVRSAETLCYPAGEVKPLLDKHQRIGAVFLCRLYHFYDEFAIGGGIFLHLFIVEFHIRSRITHLITESLLHFVLAEGVCVCALLSVGATHVTANVVFSRCCTINPPLAAGRGKGCVIAHTNPSASASTAA